MRSACFLFVLFLLFCSLSACQKNGSGVNPNSQPGLLLGKWSLQQQKSVIYLNGVKQTDTTYLASSLNYGHLQFNSNGTFTSSSYAFSTAAGGNLGSGVVNAVSQDSTHGTYSLVSSNLNMTTAIAGFGIYVYGYSSIAVAPVGLLTPEVSQVTLLTSSNLTIHKEYTYMLSSNTYKDVLDYYYSK
ncbi:MAG: hypothetical protein ACXVJN_16040 [Mucilaginibacter sp.]